MDSDHVDEKRRAEKRLWKPSVLVRYWLLQLPGTLALVLMLVLLEAWLGVEIWILAVVLGVWIAKDAMLYPLLWRSYDPDFPAIHTMVGQRGVAVERIDPTGFARVRGELWRAELAEAARPIEKGEALVVDGTRNLTVLVRQPRRGT